MTNRSITPTRTMTPNRIVLALVASYGLTSMLQVPFVLDPMIVVVA